MISIILTDLSFTTFLIENTTQLKDFNSINYHINTLSVFFYSDITEFLFDRTVLYQINFLDNQVVLFPD